MNAATLSRQDITTADTLVLSFRGVSALDPASMAELVGAVRIASHRGRRVEATDVCASLSEQLTTLRLDGVLGLAGAGRTKPSSFNLRRFRWA